MKLRDYLEVKGFTVWVDDSSIPAGTSFLDIIYDGIEGSATILAVLSKHFQASRFCRIEIEHAAKHRKRMVPIRRGQVAPEKLHPDLAKINWVEFPENRDFFRGADECIQAIQFDLDWAVTGVRFLQLALDWQRKGTNLLGRANVAELRGWLSISRQKNRDFNPLIEKHFQASVAALRRSTRKVWTVLTILVVLLFGTPLYVASTTPSRAWMTTDLDNIKANAVVVTRGTSRSERIWIRRDLGEVHHPSPYDAGDDVFESKHIIYEMDLRGKLIDESTFTLAPHTFRPWRVGDFRFGEPDEPQRSVLAEELIRHFESLPKEVFEDRIVRVWNAITPAMNQRPKVISLELKIPLKQLPEEAQPVWHFLASLKEAIVEHRTELVDLEYPNHLTNVEAFKLRSGTWLVFAQIMGFGMRYDEGVLPMLTKDRGNSWTFGTFVPRLSEGSGFFFNAQSVRGVVELSKGTLWAATQYNLSTEKGHPSGAPGQVMQSQDGGLTWTPFELPHSLSSVSSFTGIAAANEPSGLMALSIEDQNATSDTAGPRIWLTEDDGLTWKSVDEGLNIDPLSQVQVLWVDEGPRIVAVQKLTNGDLRPLIFRSLSFLERFRGQTGVGRK